MFECVMYRCYKEQLLTYTVVANCRNDNYRRVKVIYYAFVCGVCHSSVHFVPYEIEMAKEEQFVNYIIITIIFIILFLFVSILSEVSVYALQCSIQLCTSGLCKGHPMVVVN